ncbi:MAG: hypothetical protein HDR43_02725 [Mycoplasma sp.]|nr:hypothetical protein [Mycoplasma sp.]
MNDVIRLILIISVVVVVLTAIISYIVIFTKIRKKRKEIKQKQNIINAKLSNRESEKKMYSRKDFGKSDEYLKEILGKTISHEIVEFCINSCIRNEYKNVLLIENVEPYEAIVLSNKANVNVFIKESEFDQENYKRIINYDNVSSHSINLLNSETNIEKNKYDAIISLNSNNNFDKLFNENEIYLRENGMFIFANIKSNKKSSKKLIEEVKKYKYRYEMINWYTGFIVIVKSFV